MNTERLAYLHKQYAAKILTREEWAELKALASDPAAEAELQDFAERLWYSEEEVHSLEQAELDALYSTIIEQPQKGRTVKLYLRRLGIAAAIAFLIAGVYFFMPQRQLSTDPESANNIKPGINSATLTLSNGKQIKLTDAANGELAQEAGVVVTKTVEGQLVYEIRKSDVEPNKTNKLTTARGETYMLVLPDQSKVWLNTASSITYLTSLNEGGKRVVRLSGEAYFEVAKDTLHPFVVETGSQRIEVLGTHFNVNAYDDEPVVRTTLLEGSTRIISRQGDQRILKPGQQSVLYAGKIELVDADPDEAVAWKNGEFMFNEEQLQSILRKVERWYNVEVEYQDIRMGNKKFGGTISRFSNVSDVLRMLELTGGVHFKIKGRRIIVLQKLH